MVERETTETGKKSYDIHWESTCYLPDSHLITEASFKEHACEVSYKDYFLLIAGTQTPLSKDGQAVDNADIQSPQRDKKTTPRMSAESQDSDIFEDPVQDSVNTESKTVGYDSKTVGYYEKVTTKYHTLLQQPKPSEISKKQRKFYKAFTMNQNKTHSAEAKQKFQLLMQRVHAEQMEYQNFLRNCAQTNIMEYIYLSDDIKDFVLKHVENEIMRILDTSQDCFSLHQSINLQTLPPTSDNKMNAITFVKTLSKQKWIPQLNLPELHKPLLFNKTDPMKQEQTVSQEFIDKLFVDEELNVFLPAESLVTIMTSFVDNTHDFILPIHIKDIHYGDGKSRKSIHFSSPYPRREMNSRYANNLFYKDRLRNLMHTTEQETNLEDSTTFNIFQCSDFKFLVQSQHCCFDPKTNHTFNLSTKIEYQPSIGYEQLTLIDYCTSWWHNFLSNSDYILLPRVDVRNDCIIKVDSYPRHVLCARGCPYNPEVYFPYFRHIIKQLVALDIDGKFFLERASGNTHLFLFRKNEEGKTSLATKYKDILTKKKELLVENVFPWLPVDTNMLPKNNLETGVIPCLFDSAVAKPGGGVDGSKRGKGTRNNARGRGRKRARYVDTDSDASSTHLFKLGQKPSTVKPYGKQDELEFF